MVRHVVALCLTLLALGPATAAVAAQELQIAGRGPRFFAAGAEQRVSVDGREFTVLRRRVTLALDRVPLDEALKEITRQAGLQITYSRAVVPVDRPVSLHAQGITVAAALTEILFDFQVDVSVARSGHLALVRREGGQVAVQAGSIVGRVTDAKTGEELVGAEVSLDDTRLRTTTGDDGRYRLSDVAPGEYTLAVRRIGYRRATRAVTVVDGDEVVVDVGLEAVPTQLDEVVTTVTGEQRLRELGHVVGRINADSLVKAAPVSSLGELLTGRVPGLQVFQAQGTVGGEVSLRVRGVNTIQLNTDPIIIVDGIRYTGSPPDRGLFGVNGVEPTSPLNDLNPNDIASIEVVKGPSAATLYGTDAANGVIVITTKRGQAGPTQWNAYIRGALTEIPDANYPDTYWGWRTVGGEPSLTSNCHLGRVVSGSCSQDSVGVLTNPLNDPALTLFGSKPRWEYGANISGGSERLRYFVAGDIEQATGPIRLPPGMADSMAAARGGNGLPNEQLEPNASTKGNLRLNVTLGLGKTAEFRANAGYSHRTTRTFGVRTSNSYAAAILDLIPSRCFEFDGNQNCSGPYGFNGPDQDFARTSTERVGRFFASVAGRLSPAPWLQIRAIGGVDLASSRRSSLARRGETIRFSSGAVGDEHGRQVATTGELAATASFSWGRVSSRTSVGAQYVRTLEDVLSSTGTDLPPGGSSVGEAANIQVSQHYRETVTLGSYLEQVVGLNQRLFLTGALRIDGASTFGRDYNATVYPKAGVSWLVSEESVLARLPLVDELRLRYAFGASGQQPRPEWARPEYELDQAFLGGEAANVYAVNSLGNPRLRPERVREHEFGFDVSLLEARLQAGLTWYRRTTEDQIVSVNLPAGMGRIQTNLGRTSGRGFEAQVSVRPIDTRAVSWSLAVQHSLNRTVLENLGGVAESRSEFGGYVEGYPLGVRFMVPIVGYSDTNGDGILSSAEVERGDEPVYFGESTPPRSQTVTTSVGLFEGSLRLGALVERRSGHTQLDRLASDQCSRSLCRARVDPSTPLADQATAVAMAQFPRYYVIEAGNFTRLREVSVAVDLPARTVRAFGLSSATLSVQGRNLALWTSYSGADPESASLTSAVSSEVIGIPQGRSWVVRVDVGF